MSKEIATLNSRVAKLLGMKLYSVDPDCPFSCEEKCGGDDDSEAKHRGCDIARVPPPDFVRDPVACEKVEEWIVAHRWQWPDDRHTTRVVLFIGEDDCILHVNTGPGVNDYMDIRESGPHRRGTATCKAALEMARLEAEKEEASEEAVRSKEVPHGDPTAD